MIFVTATCWITSILAGYGELLEGSDKPRALTGSGRFAVIRFSGTSEFPHANQISGIGDLSAQNSSKVSKSGFEYLLVADQQQDELYLYSRVPLWRLDTGGVDEDWKTLRHQHGETIDTYDVETGKEAGSSADMWAVVNVKSVFVDVLGLPVTKPVKELNAKIQKLCEGGLDFGISESLTDGATVTKRVVNNDTGELGVSTSVSGQLFAGASAELHGANSKSARCTVIVYLDNKPMEMMRGTIECTYARSLPAAISEMLNVEAKPLEDDWTSEESDHQQADQLGQKPDRRWTLLAMAVGAACLVAAFVLRLVQAKKENPVRQIRQKNGR
jgi:hypothetical protein